MPKHDRHYPITQESEPTQRNSTQVCQGGRQVTQQALQGFDSLAWKIFKRTFTWSLKESEASTSRVCNTQDQLESNHLTAHQTRCRMNPNYTKEYRNHLPIMWNSVQYYDTLSVCMMMSILDGWAYI